MALPMFKAAKALQKKAQGFRDQVRAPVADFRDQIAGNVQAMLGGAPAPATAAAAPPAGGASYAPPAGTAGLIPDGYTVDNLPGSGPRGAFQKGTTPGFLQDSPVGYMQQALLASLMGADGRVSRQFLNQDLANIRSSTQQQQQQFAGNQRFRGSGVGAAIGQAMGQAGVGMESRRLAEADQEELQRKLMVSQAMSQGFLGPLMQALGMGNQGFENMMQRAAVDAAQPNQFSQGVGMLTNLVGAFMCWVARAVLRDERWTDARIALIQEGSPRLLSAYLANGQALARRVDSDPSLRAELTPVFEDLAKRGAEIRRTREEG